MFTKNAARTFKMQMQLHIMLIPAVVLVFIFNYIPMAGVIIAFQRFIPAKGLFGDQQWVGFDNFRFMFKLPNTMTIIRNTLQIAIMKIIFGMIVPISACLMLNEIRLKFIKRGVQTLIYLPNFLSWVIFGGVLLDILSPNEGIVNKIIQSMGFQTVYFLGDPKLFQGTIVFTDIWKSFGFSTIVYLAAVSNIDPTLYETAAMDGAKRFQCVLFITLPSMLPIIILLATLNLGNILNAGFEQIFNMYSPQVYSTGDIIDTFVYRTGLIDAQYSLATAVGLMKSSVAIILISLSYYLAYRFADYRIF